MQGRRSVVHHAISLPNPLPSRGSKTYYAWNRGSLGVVHRDTRAVGRNGAHLEFLEQAILALSPALLVFQLILMQGGRLLDAMRDAEFYRLFGGLLSHIIPGGAEGELIGYRPDAACVDVAAQRHAAHDRTGPVGRLPIQRHG